jgi:AcrR family transcriptional regulator
VFQAALALVRESGYPSATIEAIAARSGVAKTTIYRRWPQRTALFVDLLVKLADAALPHPDRRTPRARCTPSFCAAPRLPTDWRAES